MLIVRTHRNTSASSRLHPATNTVAQRLESRLLLSASRPPSPMDWGFRDGPNAQWMGLDPYVSTPPMANDSNGNGIDDTREGELLQRFNPMIAPPGLDNTATMSVTEFLSRSHLYDAQRPDATDNPVRRLVMESPTVESLQQVVDSHQYSTVRDDNAYNSSYPRANLGVFNEAEPNKAASWAGAKIYARAFFPANFPPASANRARGIRGVYVFQYYWLYIQDAAQQVDELGNDVGDHEGDMTSVDFTIDDRGSEPRLIGAIMHNHGRQFFVQPTALQFSGTHPVIYTEEGTNECWPNPGIGGSNGWPKAGVTANSLFGGVLGFADENDVDHDHWGGDNSEPDPANWHVLHVVNLGNLIAPPIEHPEWAPQFIAFTAQSASDQAEAKLLATFPGSWGNTLIQNWITDSNSPRGPYFNSGGKMWDRTYNFGTENAWASLYTANPDPAPTTPFATALGLSEFWVTAEPGSTVHVLLDGADVGPANGADGLYSFSIPNPPPGSHTITVTSTNWTGMPSAESPTVVWDAGTDVGVNTTTEGRQVKASVATDPAGDAVIVWRGDDGDGTVYGQQYDAAGRRLRSEFRVAVGNGSDGDALSNGEPSVAMDAAGNFVVAWPRVDPDGDGFSNGIYAREYTNAGDAGPIFHVSAAGMGGQSFVQVAMDAKGDFAVVWQSKLQGEPDWNVMGRWYDPTGAPVTGVTPLSPSDANDSRLPAVAMDPAGETVVTWASESGPGLKYNLLARRFAAGGIARDPSELLIDDASNQLGRDQSGAPLQSVSMDAMGNFVVAWTAADSQGNGIYARRYDASGVPRGNRFPVNKGTGPEATEQFYPSVAANAQGDFAIAWQTAGGSSPNDIYLYWYDSSGILVDGRHVNEHTVDSQDAPKLAMDGRGNMVVAWQSHGQDGSDWGIYARRFTGSIVVGRKIFYNNSAFDEHDSAANALDDASLDAEKHALLAGEPALLASYTSYSRGINGIMVDVAALPGGAGPTADDFDVQLGNVTDAANSWSAGPRPSVVSVRRGAGTAGSDRITLTWADGAIRNTWLRVTLKPNERTGLRHSDVFYFGNLIGDTGDSDTAFRVNALDLAGVKKALNMPAPIISRFDFNRDGRVNALDVAALKQNLGKSLGAPSVSAAVAPASVFFAGAAVDVPDELTIRRVWDEATPGVV